MLQASDISAREKLAALPDSIRLGAGYPVSHPHPLAQDVTMRSAASAAATLAYGNRRFQSEALALDAGMATIEFSRSLATAADPAVIASFDALAGHRRFCAHLPARDFRPFEVANFDALVSPLRVGEGGEIAAGYVSVGPGISDAVLVSYAREMIFTRQKILNDRYDLLMAAAAQVGASGARLEAEHVAAALAANPTLDDGGPFFAAERDNVIASALDSTTLAQAMAMLRTQPLAGGGKAGLSLAHLVVEPALEYLALKLLRDVGLEDRVSVTVLTGLPTGRWFAFAEPAVAPAVAVLTLGQTGQHRPPIKIEPAKGRLEIDGAILRILADVGASLCSPVGIVRGGA